MIDETAYGFTWPLEGACDVVVERLAVMEKQRVIGIRTGRRSIDIYISRTGLIRVFMGHKELKAAAKAAGQ